MNKIVTRINWVNDTDPAINDTHLNQMDSELDAIDDRVIAMEGTVETQAENAEAWAVGERGGDPVAPTDPTYDNNSKHYAEEAASSASDAAADALKSEGFAVGEQGGTPVSSGSPYYENNAKHYAGEAADSASDASTDAAAAASSAEDAEAWSEGTRGGVPVGPGDPAYQHNAHYWEQQAQGAIAGVTSFTGAQGTQRSGPVTAQSGDYNDGMITVDRTGTSLPASVNDLHDVLELLYPQGATVTLTLNGAKNDVITIKDSNDQTVATCTFATGQTSGSVQLTVPVGGASFKFVSSKAKGITPETLSSDYEKEVALTDAVSQTVNVYPKNALSWFGNLIKPMSATGYGMANLPNTGTIAQGNDKIDVASSGTGSIAVFGTNEAIDFSQFNSLKAIEISNADDGFGIRAASQKANIATDALATINTTTGASVKITSLDLSSVNASGYVALFVGQRTVTEMGAFALWLDDGHEDDLTIHGAKEDTITITDSQNQTVATCVFGSGKTYGYVSKALLPSGTYKFTSSVAKDTTTGTSDYEKTITLDGTESEVNVYPDGMVYWYGNGSATASASKYSAVANANAPTITVNTNSLKIQQTTGSGEIGGCADFGTYDLTTFTSCKINFEGTNGGYTYAGSTMDFQTTLSTSMTAGANRIVLVSSGSPTFDGIKTADVTSESGTKHIIVAFTDNTSTPPMTDVIVKALWLE